MAANTEEAHIDSSSGFVLVGKPATELRPPGVRRKTIWNTGGSLLSSVRGDIQAKGRHSLILEAAAACR